MPYKPRPWRVWIVRKGGNPDWSPARVRPRPALPGQPSASAGHIAQKRSLTGHSGLVMNIGPPCRSMVGTAAW
eukprot:scaffold47747_cov90-Phaeocystis_antarctica.AAC.1